MIRNRVRRRRSRPRPNREIHNQRIMELTGSGSVTHADIRIRDEFVDGVGPWHWLFFGDRFESGSWIGPAKEFPLVSAKVLPLLKGRDLVLSAGGCQGLYPRLWSRYFKKVVSLEPDPQNFEVMKLNCTGDNYWLLEGALGDVQGKTTLYRFEKDNVGMHSTARVSENSVIVNLWRVDDLKLEALDLLQLDVEGAEPRVLIGARETIEKFRPVITVETCNDIVEKFMEETKYKFEGNVGSDKVFAPRFSYK